MLTITVEYDNERGCVRIWKGKKGETEIMREFPDADLDVSEWYYNIDGTPYGNKLVIDWLNELRECEEIL